MKNNEINFEKYWDFLDDKHDELLKNGYVKFPSIESLDLELISSQIASQIENKTYTELNSEHKIFLDKLLLDKYLAPKLFEFAQKKFQYNGQISNQYHVARLARPGEHKYRAHFDSHIFTLVIPIRIPKINNNSNGELLYFPNMRLFPKNELIDFFGKLYTKKYSSESGIRKLSTKKQMHTNDFTDYAPLLFFGNTVFHANMPISKSSESYRLTLLAHYFDPFPKYSVGNLLRKIRFR